MKILEGINQGSQEWRAARAHRFTASQAPAMMGASKYQTRAELLREKATGITPEVTPDQQRLFDRGHAAETAARQWAEAITGEELAPVVATLDVDGLPLLASFDGIDFMGEVIWENKLLNQSLIAQIDAGELEPHYHFQLEHQLLVSGASRALFTTSDGTEANTHSLWYESRPERRAALIAGWEQFEKDVAAYVPTEPVAPVVAAPMESLPAVVVQVQGALTVGGNLDAFGLALRAFIARIPAKPATDQQFADAEAACKALKKAEDALAQAEDGALAQISDVEVMRRTVADLKELARSTRLATEKLVKAEKDARRTEKVMAARQAFETHVTRLQMDIKGVRLIVPMPDFGGSIKGLSSLASIDDKLTAALIAGKAEANTLASRIAGNLQTLDSVPQYAHLFADRQELAYKDYEVLELLMQKRVDAEAARIEAERERIRQEEERKAQAAAEAKAEAERARIRAEEQQKAQAEAAEREAAARRERILAEAAKPAVTRALEAIEREKDAAPGKPLAPAPTIAAPVAAGIAPVVAVGSASDDTPELTLGAINERLSPISLSAAGLAEFGIEPLATKKAAKLYSQSQFEQLCRAIVRCATDALRGELDAA
jgi:putative phage-type endonuclease